MTDALVIVDLQLGMLNGALCPPLPDGDALLARVAALLDDARARGVPIVHIRHGGGAGDPLETGSDGWHLHPKVAPISGEPVVDKTVRNGFDNTRLLEALGPAKRLTFAGAQSEVCVAATCRGALAHGFKVALVADAHGTWPSDGRSAADISASINDALAAEGVELV